MGIWGMRRVLTLTTAVCAAALLVLALIPMGVAGYMVFGLIAGLSTPRAVGRAHDLPQARQRTPADGAVLLDASLQEIIWILAPVVITLVATQVGTVPALLLIVVDPRRRRRVVHPLPEVGRVRIPRSRRAFGKVLGKPVVLLATVIGFLLIGACAAVEAAVVATFGHGGFEAGLVLAVFSVGSPRRRPRVRPHPHGPVGDGATHERRRRRPRRLVFVVGDIGPSTPWWVGACLLVAGVGIAPALAVMFAMTSASVKFSETAEAYGWIGTGQLIGAALGSAVAGFLIDGAAPPAPTRPRRVRDRRRARRDRLRAGLPRPARPRREPDPRHRTRPRHHVTSSSTTDSATVG
jgi:hypothetical protein